MTKKKVKKVNKIIYKGPKLEDMLPNNRGERLQLIIKMTKKSLSNPILESEQYLLDQIKRLELELDEWRKNESRIKD